MASAGAGSPWCSSTRACRLGAGLHVNAQADGLAGPGERQRGLGCPRLLARSPRLSSILPTPIPPMAALRPAQTSLLRVLTPEVSVTTPPTCKRHGIQPVRLREA